MIKLFDFRIWILCHYFVFVCVRGSGYVEVRFRSYLNKNGTDDTGKCCDTKGSSGCDPCDPYFESFLTQGSLGANLSEIVTTGFYNNTNVIHFGTSVGKITNPFKLTFVNFTNTLVLNLAVWDDDRFETTSKSSDRLEDLQFNVGQGEPSPFYANPNFVAKVIKGNAVEFEFEYRILCHKNFYGNCNKFCKPKVTQYNCSSAGSKVCELGWSGKECDTGPCQGHKCEHNSTCVPNQAGDYNCSCPPSYSGKMCDIKIAPPTVSTTSKQMSSNQVTTINIISTQRLTSVSQGITNKPSDKIGIIVGCSVAAVFLIAALLVLLVCVILKKQKGRTNVIPSISS